MDIIFERQLRGQILEHFAGICKAFGHANRLELLGLLAQGEHSVDELSREAYLPVASVSQHLQVLRQAGLVAVRRSGVRAYYRLENDAVYPLLQAVHSLGVRRLPESNALLQFIRETRSPETEIYSSELLDLQEQGRVFVIDVRPGGEYRSGHIRGAISLPLDELEQHLAALPADRLMVVYCRGAYSTLADRAAAWLRARGFAARRLQDGFPAWQFRGLPVEGELYAPQFALQPEGGV